MLRAALASFYYALPTFLVLFLWQQHVLGVLIISRFLPIPLLIIYSARDLCSARFLLYIPPDLYPLTCPNPNPAQALPCPHPLE